MKRFVTGLVGCGKSVHAVHATGEAKGRTACGRRSSLTHAAWTAITCRGCSNALPSWTVVLTDEEQAEVETEALEENARREAARAPRKLDIWLTKGVVLVDPMLEGDQMVFERWVPKGAEVRNQRTGVRHVVSQSYITTWKYVPRRTDVHQVWRSKEGGALVRVVESRVDAVHLIGPEPGDVPFWLSHEQLTEYFTWEPGGTA